MSWVCVFTHGLRKVQDEPVARGGAALEAAAQKVRPKDQRRSTVRPFDRSQVRLLREEPWRHFHLDAFSAGGV